MNTNVVCERCGREVSEVIKYKSFFLCKDEKECSAYVQKLIVGDGVYHKLTINAKSPKTKIWVADEEGHLVQMEVGVMKTSLRPGKYKVRFTLEGQDREFELKSNLSIEE